MSALVAARFAALLSLTTLLLIPAVVARGNGDVDVDGARAIVFAGAVTDAAGAALAGATVHVAPWNSGGVTDATGRYVIVVSAARTGDRATVTVQHVGFNAVSSQLRVDRDTVRVDFKLETAVLRLAEVLVAGKQLDQARNPVAAPALGMAGMASPSFMMRSAAERRPTDPGFNTESYAAIDENPFLAVSSNPLSTFSIDVDRASYANVRRFIKQGVLPPKDAVRIEELVNYFPYADAAPDGKAPFAVTMQLAPAPWRPAHHLLRIALKAKAVESASAPPSNLVFLIDVSGSMMPPNKLPLLKQAFGLLVNELRAEDRVAMVVYAGNAGLVLESTPGHRKEEILAAIERLEAGGSTAGGAGLRLAYDVALRHHIPEGNNRVILATDGDFNIGVSSDAEMMRLVEEKRAQGTFLTVLGFGVGNLKDSKMEILADKGNGNYAYIDDLSEARKVLVEEMGGTLFTVAKDVKLQIEFNPTTVRGYRLIGYENRLLAAEDFNDDRKDAGELGAGHSVTALYEIVPVGAETDVEIRTPDPLRYSAAPEVTVRPGSSELGFVKLRFKSPDGDQSELMERAIVDRRTRMNADFTFSAAVAAFGMLLRDSPHRGSATFDSVLALARDGLGEDRGGHRKGFIELVEAARSVAAVVDSGTR